MKKTLVLIMLLLTMALCLIVLPVHAEEAAAPVGITIDLTGIAQAVIALAAALITYKLVPWIKSKTTVQQQAIIKGAIDTAVFAAEQIYGSGAGKAKMDYVQARLLAKGYTIDLDAIEAAVRRLTIEQDAGTPVVIEGMATNPVQEDEQPAVEEETNPLIAPVNPE